MTIIKRYASTTSFDPTITSRVRTTLYESGKYELVTEQLVDGIRDVETMIRNGLTDHDKRLRSLEEAERNRLTETTVLGLIKQRAANQTAGLSKKIVWAMACGVGTALLGLVGWVLSLAWKGFVAK